MPCYDKKLEASREDFYNDIYRTRDVDCVISTRKLLVKSILQLGQKFESRQELKGESWLRVSSTRSDSQQPGKTRTIDVYKVS